MTACKTVTPSPTQYWLIWEVRLSHRHNRKKKKLDTAIIWYIINNHAETNDNDDDPTQDHQ